MEVKLDIKNCDGKVLHTIRERDFDFSKPLIFSLDMKDEDISHKDTKMLKVTRKNIKLVLS